jgi:hypothetical protein
MKFQIDTTLSWKVELSKGNHDQKLPTNIHDEGMLEDPT